MTAAETPSRESIIAIVAAHNSRPEADVPEQIDSLGVVWLVYESERRFGITLDLDDEVLARMSTVTGAVELLQAAQRQGVRAGG
ncbi:MAG TPA: acyl carrier protein [Streptosporangiaceae bacterium]|jgi:acyl carrier protein|nr:acyl carrier protein [Streptosporangiaceae bacterium]